MPALLKRKRNLTASKKKSPLSISLNGKPVPLAASTRKLVLDLLNKTAHGKRVILFDAEKFLTTQQAADLLDVSRPHVVHLIDNGLLPARKVGKHRRILASHVLAYKEDLERRLNGAAELTAIAQELNMGY